MTKVIKKIAKSNLDSNHLKNNHLSIQLSLDGFSFCSYFKPTHELVNFGVYEFDEKVISPFKHIEFIEELFQNELFFTNKFDSVRVCHINNLVAQVPNQFFDETKLENYLKYSVKVLENDFITYDEIEELQLINVYIPFVNINNFLLDKFGPFTFKHASTVLIEKLAQEYKNAEGDLFFVNIRKSTFEVVILKSGKLELFNTFTFKTKEDFIYYILFTAEQLHLNTSEFELILLGEIKKETEIYNLLTTYIKNVKFYNPKSYPKLLKNIEPHSYFTLLNLY